MRNFILPKINLVDIVSNTAVRKLVEKNYMPDLFRILLRNGSVAYEIENSRNIGIQSSVHYILIIIWSTYTLLQTEN